MLPVGLGWPGIVTGCPSSPQCPALISKTLPQPGMLTAKPLLHPPTGVRYREPPQNGARSSWRLYICPGRWPVVTATGILAVPRMSVWPAASGSVVTVT
jgi:hypothetical protein